MTAQAALWPRLTQRFKPVAELRADVAARFQVALLASILVHLLLIVGVGIRPPDPGKLKSSAPALEVVLVNTRSVTAPAKPDALAQANLDGGGTVEAPRRARNPLPVTPKAQPQPEPKPRAAPARPLEPAPESRSLLAQSVEPAPALAAQPEPAPKQEPVRREPVVAALSASELRSRGLEVARLEAQVSKNWDSYQQRPRTRFIGARTQEFRFARYVEDWRLKIERVGTLNYPQAARDQQIYGSLQLTVVIRADGSVETVELNRPSGHRVLDQAALRIVQLAAPFAPFPPEIARDYQFLSITRTWTFTRADQFQGE